MKASILRTPTRLLLLPLALAAACLILLLNSTSAGAQEYVPLYSFPFATGTGFDDDDGASTVIQGTDGNLYGTTFSGGTAGYGTLFKLSPSGQFTILHSFSNGIVGNEGFGPSCNMIQATDGNFYGETQYGGSTRSFNSLGDGTIFRYNPTTNQFTVLHSFGTLPEEVEAIIPYDGLDALVQGSDGNFYGANFAGGIWGGGSIFQMTPSGMVTLLYSFPGQNDGAGLDFCTGLIVGTDGNFYGTTNGGGSVNSGLYNSGTVFWVTPAGTETVLYSFNTTSLSGDGAFPDSGVIQGADGNFYGTTSLGGVNLSVPNYGYGGGTVFRLTPGGTETVLHRFGDGSVSDDGFDPEAGVIQGLDGNFYGTTMLGGPTSVAPHVLGYGTLFVMSPYGTETILHNFGDGSVPNDGQNPAYLYPGLDGNIYGTTIAGGSAGGGTIFEIVMFKKAPPAPTQLTASLGMSQINLAWHSSPGASTYNIYRATSSGAETLYQSGVTGASYADTNVTIGTTYYYEVTGVNKFGESGKSNEANATLIPPPLPPVLTASVGNVLVSLSWTTSSGATSYNLYRATSSGAETLYAAGVTGTSYTDTSVTGGTTYYYEVTAVSARGETVNSNEASATPYAPFALVATPGPSRINLSWIIDVGATSYDVLRSTSSGTETLYEVGLTGTTYANTGLTTGGTYYYEVEAFNAGGYMATTNEAFAVPVNLSPPLAPINLVATGGNGEVGLNWKASAGATSYNVYRGTFSGQEMLYYTGATGTSYTDTSVTNDSTYYYEVTAVNMGGESGPSNEVSATPDPQIPVAPTLTATAGNAQVSLSWTASVGATSYNLYRSTSSGTETLLQAGLTVRSCIDPGVTNGTTYYYDVTAVGAAGESGRSNEASATPEPPAPPAPANLVATAGNAQVGLSWSASAGALSYNVYRSTSSGNEILYQAGVAATNYLDTGVTNGTTYYYKVTAVNGGGQGGYSNEASATPESSPPPAPILTASAGNVQVSLSWTASAGATSYNVYRSTTSGAEMLYQAGVTGTTYLDTGVTDGVTYFYKVSAGNADGYGPLSNEVSATPKMPALPAAPTKLKATAGNTQVGLSWTAGANAASYNLYRSFSTGTEMLYQIGIAGTSFTDTGLTNGTTYFYKVKSVNAAGVSGYSNEASAKPHPPAPPAPALTATGGVKQISLSWTASAGATSYRVYRARTSGGEALLIGGITTMGYVDKSVTVGVTYYYKVVAVNAYGASPQSNEASAVAAS